MKNITKLWKISKFYTEIIIVSKFIWFMFFENYNGDIIKIIGINYKYLIFFNFGLTKNGKYLTKTLLIALFYGFFIFLYIFSNWLKIFLKNMD